MSKHIHDDFKQPQGTLVDNMFILVVGSPAGSYPLQSEDVGE